MEPQNAKGKTEFFDKLKDQLRQSGGGIINDRGHVEIVGELNESHRLALKYLESKRPEFVSAEEVGREIGDQLGMEGWGSAFGLPLCNKLVSAGLVVQNNAGHFAAATK